MIYSHIIIYIYKYIYMYKLLHHINSAPCFSNLVATGMALKALRRYAHARPVLGDDRSESRHRVFHGGLQLLCCVAAWPWDVALAPTIQPGQSPAQKMDDFKHVHGWERELELLMICQNLFNSQYWFKLGQREHLKETSMNLFIKTIGFL
jgi:hypothetical protein